MTTSSGPLEWLDHETLACPRARILAVFDDRSQNLQSTPEQFILMKSRSMVDWYEMTFAGANRPSRVLEIGIFKGGSVVLFSELWQPQRLVAVDIAADPIPALDEYISRYGLSDHVSALYGVDQADTEAMRTILSEEFGGVPIDLVVDDGCHFYDETKAAFEAVFPFLRPGGVYVIEDWGWAHWPGEWQENGGPWPDKPALTMLALELAMLCALRFDLIESVDITAGLIVVRKGPAETIDHPFSSPTAISLRAASSSRKASLLLPQRPLTPSRCRGLRIRSAPLKPVPLGGLRRLCGAWPAFCDADHSSLMGEIEPQRGPAKPDPLRPKS